MKTISFTDFRQNASELMTEVENGEVLHILRHGKPVAEITPFNEKVSTPSWKKPALRLNINGKTLSQSIVEERERG